MQIVTNELQAREIDVTVKNKFRWEWLGKKVKLKLKKGEVSVLLSDNVQKVDIPGKVKCIICNDLIYYGGRGWNALASHLNSAKHKKMLEIRQDNYDLNGTNQNESDTQIQPAVPISARVFNSQATVLGFMAENNLPFSMAPHLIDLAKELARDPKALSNLSMDRTSASMKMRYGLAKTFLEETIANLQTTPFSLNIDESTSNNLCRVLSIMVSYFEDNLQKVVIEHMSSIQLFAVNSKTIYSAIHSLMSENDIPYKNLISIMMDSCRVMRGSKTGVETLIRNKQAPHLLDIDGDSCHHIHNATKKFCKEFDYHVEGLFSDLNTDFKWSAQLKCKLEELCNILSIKFSPPMRYLSHRWLSCYDVSLETIRMWDVLTIFYYASLNTEDSEVYKPTILSIYKKRNIVGDKLSKIKTVQEELKKMKPSTTFGKNRKQRIIEKLFHSRKKTLLILQVYIAVLPTLKKYVCLFQMTEPLLHKLYREQLAVFKTFLSFFIKPEILNDTTVTSETLIKEANMLPNKQLFIGFGANGTLSKCNVTISNDFFKRLRKAYIACGLYLQKKLPLENSFLICASALDPLERSKSNTLEKLEQLPTIVTNILSNNELDQFMLDIRHYQIAELPPFVKNDGQPLRIDEWWSFVFKSGEFPALSKLVKAIISCFHGPVVESTFSSMNYIIDSRSGRMDIESYSAIQTVRSTLKSKDISAIKYFHRKNVKRDPVKKEVVKNIQSSNFNYRQHKTVDKNKVKNKIIPKSAGQSLLEQVEAVALKKHSEVKESNISQVKRSRSEESKVTEPNSKKQKLTESGNNSNKAECCSTKKSEQSKQKVALKKHSEVKESNISQVKRSKSEESKVTEPNSKKQKLTESENNSNKAETKKSEQSKQKDVAAQKWKQFFQLHKGSKKA